MARLPNITRRNPLSDFQRVQPEGGTALFALADLANEAYDFLKPAAIEEQTAKGEESGRAVGRQIAAENRVPLPSVPQYSSGGLGQVTRVNGEGVGPRLLADLQRDYGLTKEQAAGIVGNLSHESGDFETLQEINPLVPGSRGGFGYAQWTGPRRRAFEQWVQQSALDPTSYEANYGFLREELDNTPEGRVLSSIRNTSSAAEAARVFSNEFLRPGIVNMGSRISRANAFVQVADNGTLTGGNDLGGEILQGGSDTIDGGNLNDGLTDPVVTPPAEPETTVRTASGKIEARRYSPLSGEILQAHNAAQGIAMISELTTAGVSDMMNLSVTKQGDPEGFQQAAEEYIKTTAQAAPEALRGDIRASLEQEAQRRYLGMVDERHREIRQRASNSNKALVERYSKDYAEAKAAGRTSEAEAIRQSLEGALYARESLPGVAWTRAQSENVLLGALDDADRLQKAARKEIEDGWGDQLDLIISAAENGLSAEDEGILQNPAIWGAHPDKAREAAARVAFRDEMPGFRALPPAERQRMVDEARAGDVSEEYEIDFIKAMESANAAANKAMDDDFIAFAGDALKSTDLGAPPAIPSLEEGLADPAGFIKALQARRQYSKRAEAAGFEGSTRFLSNEEATAFETGLSMEMETQAQVAAILQQGFGNDAGRVLAELDAPRHLRHAVAVAAAGGSAHMVQKVLVGQRNIDEGLIQIPPAATSAGAVSDAIYEATSVVGEATAARVNGPALETAKAIYGSMARGVDPQSNEATKLMEQAMQEALGQQTDRRGMVTGGVQEVNGFPTLLPPAIAPDDVQALIDSAVGGEVYRTGRAPAFTIEPDPDMWKGANGLPSYAGKPLTRDQMQDARFVPIEVPGKGISTFYRIEIETASGEVFDVETENGSIFRFDMNASLEGVR